MDSPNGRFSVFFSKVIGSRPVESVSRESSSVSRVRLYRRMVKGQNSEMGLQEAKDDVERMYTFLCTILIVFLFVYAYRHFWGWGMLAYGDLPVFPTSAREAFDAFVSSWQPESRGNILIQTPRLLYQAALLFVLGGNSVVAQKVNILWPMPVAFITMFIFLRRYVKSRLARYVGAFVYSVNPHTIGSGFLGGSYGMIQAHAVFPLLIMLSLNMLKKGGEATLKIRNMVLFGLLHAFSFSLSGATILFTTPFVGFLLLRTLMERNLKRILTSLTLIIASFGIFFLLLLPWFSFNFSVILRFLPFLPQTKQAAVTDLSVHLATVEHMYGITTMMNMLTLTWRPFTGAYVWGLVLPILAFSSLLVTQSRDRKFKSVISFSVLAVSILLFMYLTHLKLMGWLFLQFPLLFNFRNTAKPSLLLSFAYAPLIAIAIERILKRFGGTTFYSMVKVQKRHARLLSLCFAVFVLFAVALYNKDFFSGDMSLVKNRGKSIFVSETFYEIGEWTAERRDAEGFFRTLWLPWTYGETEIKVRWIDQYTLSRPLGLEKYTQAPVDDYIRTLFNTLREGQTDGIGTLLALSNVRYIIVYLASESEGSVKHGDQYLSGDPRSFAAILNKQKDLTLIVQRPDYLIYKNKAAPQILSVVYQER